MGCITQAARLRVLHIVLFRLDSDFKLEERSGLQRELLIGGSGLKLERMHSWGSHGALAAEGEAFRTPSTSPQ
jgi:hypothetical protein